MKYQVVGWYSRTPLIPAMQSCLRVVEVDAVNDGEAFSTGYNALSALDHVDDGTLITWYATPLSDE